MTIKEALNAYLNDEISRDEYLKHFTTRLEVGKTYVERQDSTTEKHFKILFTDSKIAIGVCAKCLYRGNETNFTGEYCLYHVDTGLKYQDIIRPCYLLIEEVINI